MYVMALNRPETCSWTRSISTGQPLSESSDDRWAIPLLLPEMIKQNHYQDSIRCSRLAYQYGTRNNIQRQSELHRKTSSRNQSMLKDLVGISLALDSCHIHSWGI